MPLAVLDESRYLSDSCCGLPSILIDLTSSLIMCEKSSTSMFSKWATWVVGLITLLLIFSDPDLIESTEVLMFLAESLLALTDYDLVLLLLVLCGLRWYALEFFCSMMRSSVCLTL